MGMLAGHPGVPFLSNGTHRILSLEIRESARAQPCIYENLKEDYFLQQESVVKKNDNI